MTNSGSNLKEGSNNLVKLNYSDLLDKIIEVLDKDHSQKLFKVPEDGKRLLMNVDEIAYQVALLSIESPFLGNYYSTKCASINFIKGSEKKFSNQLHLIQAKVKTLLENALPKQDNSPLSIQDYLETIAIPLENLKGKVNSNNISFNYPFDKQYTNLQKQRLTLPKDNPEIPPLLRFHKLSITVEQPTSFLDELRSSLENYIDNEDIFSTDEQEDLTEILDNLFENQAQEDNGIYLLKKLMTEQALGKLKKAASIKYLEFLYEQVKTDENAVYLQDLIRRLKIIEAYINDETKADDYYKVCYQGVCFNYREFFNNSYAFDSLPIIPEIKGCLGEINDKDQDKQEFIFGMKLKLNGQVQTSVGESSFDYHINCLDLDNKENKDKLDNDIEKDKFIRKILKIVFLYYFVFASRSNPLDDDYDSSSELIYDPLERFETFILPTLKDSNEQDKKELLLDIIEIFNNYNVSEKIDILRRLLIKLIENKKLFKSKSDRLKISISQGILEKDIDNIDENNTLFKPELNQKVALKYISIDQGNVDTHSLCRLSVDLKFSDIQYFDSEEKQQFSMEYDLRQIKTIPMILIPEDNKCKEIYKQELKQQTPLVCHYNYERLKKDIFNQEDNPKAFWYQLTFSLLTYLSLKVLLYQSKTQLFIPLLRLHLTDKDDASPEEVFMRSFSYVLSHILNEKHLFSSQGICIKNINVWKNRNSLSSLYSILPKVFNFDNYTPNLDKLAIIVVSSRECDRPYKNEDKISNMMGEVICLYRQKDKTIRLYNQGTFSGNYDSQQIYKHPDVLIDKVNELYKQGYRQFLYIAKSPYSNYLNITGKDRELFFMSPEIIKELKADRKDMKIYPVFFDKYYVVKLKKINASSLYIQDTLELTQLVKDIKDASHKSIVFFNLFNGITVGNKNDRSYNGVISYTTLLNIYDNIEHDNDIYKGLINDGNDKKDILNYLTLFHFSRYEAASKMINLKLDPYQNLIGDNSVGALSIFKHSNNKTEFNSLAFLTEVRRFLNIQPETEETK
jgi:hypothetical protein